MGKRRQDHIEKPVPCKRRRLYLRDRFSALSDELLLVLLSYLSVHDLIRCQQVSSRLRTLATDPQLWKAAYYGRFVRPRAARIPGLREAGILGNSMLYSSKISRWLEDERLVRGGATTDWKKQYKLRHNWSKGHCRRTETEISERPSIPPVLVRLHESVIVTADPIAGLRAWCPQGHERLLACMTWSANEATDSGARSRSIPAPSSLAIDASSKGTDNIGISVGFVDGSFGIFALDRRKRSLSRRYLHPPSTNGTVTAIAFSFPHVLTMTESHLLSLYIFPAADEETRYRGLLGSPRLLSSLKSQTARPPLSLAIRCSSAAISISVAYAMPNFTRGWSVGLQELRFTDDGKSVESRIATPMNGGFVPLMPSSSRIGAPLSGVEAGDAFPGCRPHKSVKKVFQDWYPPSSAKPTSLSYSHPYLLVAHSDNTMTLYMVTSTAFELSIGAGHQLWGHTSSVSGAYVGDRGKAVSVSTQSNDIRVWELEGGVYSTTPKQHASVVVRSDRRESATAMENPHGGKTAMSEGDPDEPMASKGWLSFDEEHVVLLGEKSRGAQTLIVCNFA